MQAGQRINSPSALAAEFLRKHWTERFETVIITGSGFTYEPRRGTVEHVLPYREVPGMPIGGVEGHALEFRTVRIGSSLNLLCSGRFHLYEGHSRETSHMLIDVAHRLGIGRAVIMNAVGALNSKLRVGQIVTPIDLLEMFLPAGTARRAPGVIGERSDWLHQCTERCLQHGIVLTPATYIQVLGPSYETRAEARMLQRMGADIVGMSTTIEAHRARQLGMDAVVLSLVTNVLTDSSGTAVTHAEVIEAAHHASRHLSNIIEHCVA